MFGFVSIRPTLPLRLSVNTKPLTSPQARRALLLLRGRHGSSVLGDSLGALRDGVLGKLSGENEPDGSLDLAGLKGHLLVVLGELSGLSGDALEDVVDEGVHDGHSLLGDSGVGVDLLEDLVDVGAVALDTLLGFLSSGLLGGLGGFLAGGLGDFDKGLGRGREEERVRKGWYMVGCFVE